MKALIIRIEKAKTAVRCEIEISSEPVRMLSAACRVLLIDTVHLFRAKAGTNGPSILDGKRCTFCFPILCPNWILHCNHLRIYWNLYKPWGVPVKGLLTRKTTALEKVSFGECGVSVQHRIAVWKAPKFLNNFKMGDGMRNVFFGTQALHFL